jgi:outer membrane protein TolC
LLRGSCRLKQLRCRWIALGAFVLLSSFRATAQVSLYTAVDMALRNSTAVHIAEADVRRAVGALTESKDAYLPNFVVGSSLGYSYGFPLGQPSVYDVSSQSLFYSFSQPDYIRAARSGLKAARLNLEDSRQQVILDTSLDYIQLDKAQQTLSALDQEKQFAARLVSIEEDRVVAGVESRVELTKAKISAAQIDLKAIHLQNEADLLRERLAHLTGLPASGFITNTSSIPATPEVFSDNDLEHRVATINAGVQAADANAKSKFYISAGDDRQNYRPQIGLAATYSRFAKFNNYDQYYSHFQHNNFGIGLQIQFPLFDASRKAKAVESAAEATRAAAEAAQARNTASEQVFQLQKSLAELNAQRRLAQLQAELAQEQLDVIATRLTDGSGSPNAPTVTPKDEQQAHLQERQRYEDMLDANFALTRATLGLMRSLGTIEDWAKAAPQN